MAEWTDELKAQVVEEYEAEKPVAENSIEIVNELAKKHGKTVNGTRMILSKAGVYVCGAKAKAVASSTGDKKPRVTKQDSIDALTELLEAQGVEVDDAVVGKLTGKAAIYFTGVVEALIEE